METLTNKMIYFALIVVLIVAIWKITKAYISEQSVKKQVKQFIFTCIILGAAPGLLTVFSHFGESIVQPLNAITDYVTKSVSTDLTNSIPKKGN